MRACLCLILIMTAFAAMAAPCVQTGGSTALQNALSNLGDGEWCQFNTNGLPGALQSAAGTPMLYWTTSAPWNPVTNQVMLVTKRDSTGNNDDDSHWLVTYDEATNTWSKSQAGLPNALLSGCAPVDSLCLGHGYDASTVDGLTGDLYFYQMSGTLWKRSTSNTWTSYSAPPNLQGSKSGALAFVSFTGTLRQGYQSDSGGIGTRISEFNGSSWTELVSQTTSIKSQHWMTEYDPITNTTVFLGGGTNCAGERRVWVRDESNGTITQKLEAPYTLGVSSSSCYWGPLVNDPINGGFMALLWTSGSNGDDPNAPARSETTQYQHYDPDLDTWTVYDQRGPYLTPWDRRGMLTSINEYGGAILITVNSTSSNTAFETYLYRPPQEQQVVECNDDVDNDSDGNTDYPLDPGCDSAVDVSERGTAQCDDGVDNDQDGTVDEDDANCSSESDTSEHPVQCSDLADNDGDGMVDLADDGCRNANDPDEREVSDRDCSDSIDNDGDGGVDYSPNRNAAPCTNNTAFDLGYFVKPYADSVSTAGGKTGCYAVDLDCDPLVEDDSELIGETDGVCVGGSSPGATCWTATASTNCPGGGTCSLTADCNDGRDNDGDRACDYAGCTINSLPYPADPGCSGSTDTSELSDDDAGNDDPGAIAACDNGIDDDGDGYIDHTVGLCSAAQGNPMRWAPCGRFNDYNCGGVCSAGSNAGNACISSVQCPGSSCNATCGNSQHQCDNGIDDDGDGDIDYPDDTGCVFWLDLSEGATDSLRPDDEAENVSFLKDVNCETWDDTDESGPYDGFAGSTENCDSWDNMGGTAQLGYDTKESTCRSLGFVGGELMCGQIDGVDFHDRSELEPFFCRNNTHERINAEDVLDTSSLLGFQGDDTTSSVTGLSVGAWRWYDLNSTRKAQADTYIHVVCEGYGGTDNTCDLDSSYTPWNDGAWTTRCTTERTAVNGTNVVYELWDRPDQSAIFTTDDQLSETLADCFAAIKGADATAKMTAPSMSSINLTAEYLFETGDEGATYLAGTGLFAGLSYSSSGFLDYLQANPTFTLNRLSLQLRDDANAPLWGDKLAALKEAVRLVVNDGAHEVLRLRWDNDLRNLKWDITTWGTDSAKLIEPGHNVLALSAFKQFEASTAIRGCATDPDGGDWCTGTDNLNGLLEIAGDERPVWQVAKWYSDIAADVPLSTQSEYERVGTLASKSGDDNGDTIVQILTGFSSADGGILSGVDSLDDVRWTVLNSFFGYEYGPDANVTCDVLEGVSANGRGAWLIKAGPTGAAAFDAPFDLATDCATGGNSAACHHQTLSSFVIAQRGVISEFDRDDGTCGTATAGTQGSTQSTVDNDGDGWYGTGDNFPSGYATGDPDPGCWQHAYGDARDTYVNKRAEAQLYDGEVIYLKLKCFDEPEIPTGCADVSASGLPCTEKSESETFNEALLDLPACSGQTTPVNWCDRKPAYVLYGPGDHVGDAHAPGTGFTFEALRIIGIGNTPPEVHGGGRLVSTDPVVVDTTTNELNKFVGLARGNPTDQGGERLSVRNLFIHHATDDMFSLTGHFDKPLLVEIRNTEVGWTAGKAVMVSPEIAQPGPQGVVWYDNSSFHHVQGQHTVYNDRSGTIIATYSQFYAPNNLHPMKLESTRSLVIGSIFSNGELAGTRFSTPADVKTCGSGDDYGHHCTVDADCPNCTAGDCCECDWILSPGSCVNNVEAVLNGIAPVSALSCSESFWSGNEIRWISYQNSYDGGTGGFLYQSRNPIFGCEQPPQFPKSDAGAPSQFWDSAWWDSVRASGIGDPVTQASSPYAMNYWLSDNKFVRYGDDTDSNAFIVVAPPMYTSARNDPGSTPDYAQLHKNSPDGMISRHGMYLANNCFTVHQDSPQKPIYFLASVNPAHGKGSWEPAYAVPDNLWFVGGHNKVRDATTGCTGVDIPLPTWWGASFDLNVASSGEPPVSGQVCGNGLIEGTEECEYGIPITAICQDLGPYTGGIVQCYPATDPDTSTECTFDTSLCTTAASGTSIHGATFKGVRVR